LKKAKIAILLHGMLRSWKECSTCFSYIDTLYEDVEFDFYLATWEDTNRVPINKGQHENFSDNKFLKLKKYKFYTEKEMIDNMAVSPKNHFKKDLDNKRFTAPYSFLKQKVVELASSSKIEYDACILTRTDVFIFRELLDSVRISALYDYDRVHSIPDETKHWLYYQLGDNIVYNSTGTRYENTSLFVPRDLLWFGSQKAIFEHRSFFDDSYKFCKLSPQGIHGYNASWLHFKKLYNCKTSVRDCVIVRATEIEKKEGVPDKLQLMQTIEKYGKNIYDTPLEILQQKMWT
jgi:hypothetical protein